MRSARVRGRSEEHTSELQSRQYLHSSPTRRSSNLTTTTTAARVCRNSTDPACGQFFWDPAPTGNQPLNVQITTSPPNPRAGQEVAFTVSLHDPDHALGTCAWQIGRAHV